MSSTKINSFPDYFVDKTNYFVLVVQMKAANIFGPPALILTTQCAHITIMHQNLIRTQ